MKFSGRFKRSFLPIAVLAGSFLVISLLFLAGVRFALAGFGVSPPRVVAHQLLPGSYYEEIIYLVQGNPEQDLNAAIGVEESAISGWISIDKGNNFVIPAGVQQFPVRVQVQVPADAKLGDYKGIMRVTTSSGNYKQGQVSIALGARIDLDFKVTDQEVFGFLIKSISIPDLELGWPIKVMIAIKNTGNVESRPTRLTLEIRDQFRNEQILRQGEFTDFEKIGPFREKNLTAVIPADLPLGYYWGDYALYKDDQILRSDKIFFQIVPKGTIDKSFLTKLKILLFDKIIPWLSWLKIIIILAVLALAYGSYWAKNNLKIARK